MRGTTGLIVGIIVLAVGLAGLGFAFDLMMSHADPDTGTKAAAGLVTFVVACLASLAIIR